MLDTTSNPRRLAKVGLGWGLCDETVVLFDAFFHTIDEFFEDANIKSRCGAAFGMELGAQGKPIHHFTFDRFDHAIGAFRGDAETGCDFVDRHVVAAADTDFAVAIDATDQRIADHVQRVAMVGILWDRGGGPPRAGLLSRCKNRFPPCCTLSNCMPVPIPRMGIRRSAISAIKIRSLDFAYRIQRSDARVEHESRRFLDQGPPPQS